MIWENSQMSIDFSYNEDYDERNERSKRFWR